MSLFVHTYVCLFGQNATYCLVSWTPIIYAFFKCCYFMAYINYLKVSICLLMIVCVHVRIQLLIYSVVIASHKSVYVKKSNQCFMCLFVAVGVVHHGYYSKDLGLFCSYSLSKHVGALGLYFGCSFGSLSVVFIL
jgi:hypothetical protein